MRNRLRRSAAPDVKRQAPQSGGRLKPHLYESLGFQPYGVEPMAVLTPNGFKSKVHMWLNLSNPAPAP